MMPFGWWRINLGSTSRAVPGSARWMVNILGCIVAVAGLWVDIDTGEIMATSDLEKGALRSRRAFLSRVLAHRWDWFGTLTLDGHKLPGGLSRRSPEVVGYILEWFHRLRVDAPGFEYAVVPELHKDGSYHFHVLLSGLPASMVVPAFNGRAPVYQKGRRVYNLAPWQHDIGFTNLSAVTSSLAVGRYMGKYLTKGFHGASLRGVGFLSLDGVTGCGSGSGYPARHRIPPGGWLARSQTNGHPAYRRRLRLRAGAGVGLVSWGVGSIWARV